jgi:MFS family permease
MIGTAGLTLSARTILLAAAGLALPALAVLHALRLPTTRPSAADHLACEPGEKVPLRRVLTGKTLLVLAGGVALFQLANAAMLPVAAADAVLRVGSRAATWTAAGVLVPQIVVVILAPWLGHIAEVIGRRPVLLLGFVAVPVRGGLLAISGAPEVLPAIQAVDGVAGAAMGVVLGLIVADISRNTGRFNLCLSVLGLVAGLGATLSTSFAGLVSDTFGRTAAFLVLALAGAIATAFMAVLLPETQVAPASSDTPLARRARC